MEIFIKNEKQRYIQKIIQYYRNCIEKCDENQIKKKNLQKEMYQLKLKKTAPNLKRKLFYWALSVGKEYSSRTLNKEKISLSLSLKHKIANKLIYSKVKDKLGGRIKFFGRSQIGTCFDEGRQIR